ncbi:hypothetical protein F4820DRAFT_447046 [Hypoxylon rubiginosum]|uniref:Uncharacterized protein n=1 Tax=Hypoxylon rubiginosum TaxID=110542 RepID=A0ACB9Z5C8_9PEZI|nr:hypothetical protein F4820DRAFT_447046 [Hypoxylon rubiginosum]
MSVNLSSPVPTAAPERRELGRRQVTLTQIITYPDSTTTAVVTLDRGTPPTESPAPGWSAGAASSDGLGQAQIGIIVGCCIGAVVIGIVIWCCCTRRCGCTPYSVFEREDRSDEVIYYIDETTEVTPPRRSYYPPFPRSIPPPATPTYLANDTTPQWTAYESYSGTLLDRHEKRDADDASKVKAPKHFAGLKEQNIHPAQLQAAFKVDNSTSC